MKKRKEEILRNAEQSTEQSTVQSTEHTTVEPTVHSSSTSVHDVGMLAVLAIDVSIFFT